MVCHVSNMRCSAPRPAACRRSASLPTSPALRGDIDSTSRESLLSGICGRERSPAAPGGSVSSFLGVRRACGATRARGRRSGRSRWRAHASRPRPAAQLSRRDASASRLPPTSCCWNCRPIAPNSTRWRPLETVFQYPRSNRLANRALAAAAVLDRIASVMRREWAAVPAQARTDRNGYGFGLV